MEHPPNERESVEEFRAQRAALRNAVAENLPESGSDALIQRQLAVFAYAIHREHAAASGAEEGSKT